MTLLRPLDGQSATPLHHGDEGAAAGFGLVDVAIIVLIVAAVAALGFAAWRMIRRRKMGDDEAP